MVQQIAAPLEPLVVAQEEESLVAEEPLAVEAQVLAADTDNDGVIGTEDARNILRKSLGGTDV